ncbi:aminotransferase class III-fold pyridoxal phosphate-dependent enzyme [Wenyingzhuangia sp. chi5]|uniref:Aminotransferase class III-fold pyridoxal phosphate-dependent enzyme n=1 Tax=Wenyingzhuangia gilva TaxID=3057677 RepID=A0ABT8VP65_9FLAO|nr:aminotransferase class III-fold pyridoxal phosphate-dependent enzyme [Wenyingzhuangia sp. chi5]MDO3693770.1 aminotransferase class III-fold pyridoxal phosphate-dependent enzyme [Wenyingzhuangia sp. chi5]
MKLFDVYPLYNVTPVKAEGAYVWDDKGDKYLDLYGGHGVISIGHTHPYYKTALENQLSKIGFYSNAIQNPLQQELADKLGELSGCGEDYALFLCSSGAEANENAIKVASFYNQKSRVIAFKNGFHGRTSGAVSITDNQKIIAPINAHNPVTILPLNDIELVKAEIAKGDVSSVIVEPIQGVGGLDMPTTEFLQEVRKITQENNVCLILDEVQSGYGRSGKFFAHQHHGVKADIIPMAKGMGNGFPIGGVLIANHIEPWYGMLGTTFGGSHLACAAGIAVLDVMKQENIMQNVVEVNAYFKEQVKDLSGVKQVKGEGLMLGLEFNYEVGELRKKLIYDHKIFTGGANNKNLLRILPPLNIVKADIDVFVKALKELL